MSKFLGRVCERRFFARQNGALARSAMRPDRVRDVFSHGSSFSDRVRERRFFARQNGALVRSAMRPDRVHGVFLHGSGFSDQGVCMFFQKRFLSGSPSTDWAVEPRFSTIKMIVVFRAVLHRKILRFSEFRGPKIKLIPNPDKPHRITHGEQGLADSGDGTVWFGARFPTVFCACTAVLVGSPKSGLVNRVV